MAKTPKDFSGKNKTKDTYDKDWVFHDGAWQTKKQRKSAIAGQKEAKAYLAGINETPQHRRNRNDGSHPRQHRPVFCSWE
jgi:hypothetical protein